MEIDKNTKKYGPSPPFALSSTPLSHQPKKQSGNKSNGLLLKCASLQTLKSKFSAFSGGGTNSNSSNVLKYNGQVSSSSGSLRGRKKSSNFNYFRLSKSTDNLN